MEPKLRRRQPTSESYLDWRTRCLLNAGFEWPLARGLARDTAFDLHELLDLVDRGCPPELAVRIAAPVEWGTAAK